MTASLPNPSTPSPSSTLPLEQAPYSPKPWVFIALLFSSAFLLFFRLGYYPLWDDEACTAWLAMGVWKTGDSLAVQTGPGGVVNVMAYGYGDMLFGLYDRVHPPLQLYVMAPFMGLFGQTSLAPRVPMALFGLATVAFLLWWLKKDGATPRQWLIFSTLLITNVALWLYLRQGRYYAMGVFAFTIAAYLYLHLPERPSWRDMLKLGLVLGAVPLISSQVFATFIPAFLVDYFLFNRRRTRFSISGWVALLSPSLLAIAFILLTWNPLVIASSNQYVKEWWHRPVMIWRAFRDLNNGEMAVGGLMLAVPFVAYLAKKPLMMRGFIAVVAICIADGLADPQNPETTDYGQIRHLVPIIPLTMALAMGVIDVAWARYRWLGVSLLLLASFTNVLHWGALQIGIRIRSTQYMWAKELIHPVADPYSVAIKWLKENVPPGSTVGVDPAYMRYPLMYHAPEFVYSWQIDPRHRQRLSHLEPRQFKGVEPTDYFIAFGYREESDWVDMEQLMGTRFATVHRDPLYWRDLYRPEIIMRHFSGEVLNNPFRESILFFKRPTAPSIVQP